MMAKLMLVGWSGKTPSSSRFVTIRGTVTAESIQADYGVRAKLREEMYGTAGAVWDISGKYPKLLCTWYRDVYGNAVIRKEAKYN